MLIFRYFHYLGWYTTKPVEKGSTTSAIYAVDDQTPIDFLVPVSSNSKAY